MGDERTTDRLGEAQKAARQRALGKIGAAPGPEDGPDDGDEDVLRGRALRKLRGEGPGDATRNRALRKIGGASAGDGEATDAPPDLNLHAPVEQERERTLQAVMAADRAPDGAEARTEDKGWLRSTFDELKRGSLNIGAGALEEMGQIMRLGSMSGQVEGETKASLDRGVDLLQRGADAVAKQAREIPRDEGGVRGEEAVDEATEDVRSGQTAEFVGAPGWVQDQIQKGKGFAQAMTEDPRGVGQYMSEITAQAAPSLAVTAGAGKAAQGLSRGAQALAMWGAGRQLETGAQLRDAVTDPDGAGERREASPEDVALAEASGAVAGGLEAAGAAGLRRAVGRIVDEAPVEKSAKRLMKREIGERLGTYAREWGKASSREGATEFMQSVIADVGAKYGWDPDRQVGRDAIEGMIAGVGLASGVTTATTAGAEARVQKQKYKKHSAEEALQETAARGAARSMDTSELERGLEEEDLSPVEERVMREELDRREQAANDIFEKGTLEAIPETQEGEPAQQDGSEQPGGSAAEQQPEAEQQEPEADSQSEADRQYEVRERDDGRLSVVNTGEEVVSLGETGEVGPGSPGYDPALERYFRSNAGALEERGESAAETLGRGKSEAEVERAVANRSTSPIEILDTYRIVRERAQREAQEGATRDPVAEAIDAEGRFDTESFEAVYDSGTNRENPQVALNWLSSEEGRALDAAADEIGRETGRDVTEQDIVEHLLDNPGGPRRKSETERQADELARRFEEVTGVKLTPGRAERLGGAVDEALMPAETEGAPEALFQADTERGSGAVLATYAGPSAEGASEARAEGRTFEGRYDEKERFEIDDSEAQLSEDAQWREGTEGDAETLRGRLGDVLDHPALFEAYPELEDVQVEARVSQEASESGSFRRGREVSTGVGSGQTASAPPQIEAQAPTREGLRSVLLHEIQHAIQEREGFARGSSPGQEAASFEEAFQTASIALSRARRIQDSEQYAQEERAYSEALDDPNISDEEALRRRNEAEAHARVNRLQARAERALGRDIATLNRLERQALVEGDPSAFDAEAEGRRRYERSAGEIEARDVQARRDMDAEERAATEPYSSEDIPADRAIVRGTDNARRRMDARARGAGVQASEPTPAEERQQARTSEQSGRVPVRTDQTSGGVVPFREMVRQLEDRAGVSRVERSTTGPEGAFRPADARITARGGQSDLDTVIHEVAHALDDEFKVIAPPSRGGPDQATLDAMQDELVPTFSKHGSAGTRYDPGSAAYARAEGFAEWLRAYAADPAAAKEMAPETHRVAKEALSDEAWAAVEQFGDRLRAFASASERGEAEGVLANVREGMGAEAEPGVMGRVKRFLRKQKQKFATSEATGATWLDRAKAEITDEIAIPIKAQMLARQLRGLDEALPSDDFEALFRLFQGTETQFGQALESGMFDGEYNTVTPGGFDWLMEPMESREDLKNTAALLIAERTVEKAGQIDDAAARIAGAHDTIQQAEADLASMREGAGDVDETTVSDLEETIRDARKEMQEAAREVGYEGAPQNVEAWAEDKKRRLTGIGGGVRSDQQAAWDLVEGLQERDPEAHGRAKEAARRYREWTDSLLRFWVEKGRLSEEKYKQIRDRNQSYVPLNRVMEDAYARETDSVMRMAYDNAPDGAFRTVSKMTQSSQLIYEFQGSTREIENPYAMLIAQTQSFIREAERNEVMRAFAEPMALGDGRAEREMYDGRVMDTSKIGKEVPSEEAGTQTIYFDGEARHFDFHPDVQQAFDDMSPDELGTILSGMQSMFRFSKDAITLAPPFLVRQTLRDPQERAIKGESHATEHLTAGAAQTLGTTAVEELIPGDTKAHQFLSSVLDGEGRRQFMRDLREFERVGGAQFGWHGRSAKDYYSEMRQLMADHFGDGDIVTTLRRMKDGYKRLAQLQETANRVAEYTRKRDDYRAQGYSELDARIQAAADARGLIDFAKAGRLAKKINRVVPFFNAQIQGIASTAEAFKERPVHTATRMTMYAMATDLFFYGLNVAMSAGAGEDEQTPLDDWRQQSRYMKDFFYTVPLPGEGRRLRIPKTYEFGAISSAVVRSVDASLAAASGNETEAARAHEGLWTSFMEAYNPLRVKGALSSPAFSPFGAMANYDYFREEHIVSPHEEGKKLSLRGGTEYASPAGQALQQVFQIDARKMDYLTRNVFGGFGRLAMSASERVAGDKSSQARSLWMELSGLGTRPPAYGARDVQWVQRWAERNGETNSKPIRALDALISRYYEAPNPQEAARARKRLIETAKTLRTRIEENQQSSPQTQQSP